MKQKIPPATSFKPTDKIFQTPYSIVTGKNLRNSSKIDSTKSSAPDSENKYPDPPSPIVQELMDAGYSREGAEELSDG